MSNWNPQNPDGGTPSQAPYQQTQHGQASGRDPAQTNGPSQATGIQPWPANVLNPAATYAASASPTLTPPNARVSLLLGIGLFFAPYIFCWALILTKKKYSNISKIVSVSWLAIVVTMNVISPATSDRQIPRPANVDAAAVQARSLEGGATSTVSIRPRNSYLDASVPSQTQDRQTAAPSALVVPAGTPPARPTSYPAPCNQVSADSHSSTNYDSPVDGRCMPSSPGAVSLLVARPAPSVPSGYSDTNEFALLGSPSAVSGEESTMTSRDRADAAAAVRGRVYRVEHRSSACRFTWTDATNRLSASCPIGEWSFYSARRPSLRRTQHCESTPGSRCTDRCESNADCDGIFCGCPQARCTWLGVCTGCPSTRDCDDPVYQLSSEVWQASVTLANSADIEFARELSGNVPGGSTDAPIYVVTTFSPTGAYREVRTKRECEDEDEDDEEVSTHRSHRRCRNEVEHDTGFLIGIRILSMYAMRCPSGNCLPHSVGRGVELLRGANWSSRAEVHEQTQVRCSGAECVWSSRARSRRHR
jgi:hypothetical protein